ncbi:family 10 glycosylhydrolase [Phormidium yuhuli AB48]|uniref:Family 10 glycosylhydrolase n=1 Tax=Phormidium yuhuli AB48 TaxID=2940671 RepID=A0ABY5AVS9_9CYAN|nr:family 10 glycosylhydrolase [Phormidium yuhuli]USR92902.1 family 10 glycosylhydrolase [Phormidium yuhuli AB48]
MVNALLRRLSQLSLPVALFALPLLLPVPVHSQETTVQSRASETEVADPASEVAPPGLVVEAGDAPIDATIALRMQQELMQLLGRVESALVAAQSLGQLGDVALQSLDAELQGVTMSYVDGGTQVEAAKTLLREFPGLVRQGNYGEARSRWLEARSQLWASYPNDRPRNNAPEVRSIWLDRGTIVRAGSKAGLELLFDRFARAGINTVFFETLNAGYTIYPSQVTGQQNPLTEGWDPLQAAIELARERGMELHAWVWAFAVGNEPHNRLLGQSPSFLGPILNENPQWANIDHRGEIRHRGSRKTFLDPANLEARWYLIRIIDEIILNYDVDGVQLDYIRYPFQDPSAERSYGYGEAGRSRFKDMTGVDPTTISPRQVELWQRWTDFRVSQVTEFVGEVHQLLQRRNPELILSAAVFPQSRHDRIHKIQQDWETWIEQGIIDVIVPMTYAADTNRLGRIMTPMLSNLPQGALMVPSVKLHDLEDIVAVDQMQMIRDLPTSGYALFAAERLFDNLKEILQRTQIESVQQPIPFRQPFKAALDRHRALRAEWQWVLGSEQIWIDDDKLALWKEGDQALSEALTELANSPNREQVLIARQRLNNLQDGIPQWLRLHRASNGYQVNTWENRLRAIDELLAYGERRLGN